MKYKNDIKVLNTKLTYQGFNNIKSYNFKHKLFNSNWSKNLKRDILLTKKSVCLLPFDKKKKNILFVKQFRIGAYLAKLNPWQIEIIGGYVENNEHKLKHAIQREAKEEANLKVKSKELKKIKTVLNSSGTTNEKTVIFFSLSDLSKTRGVYGKKSENENIKVIKLKAEKAFKMVDEGKVNSVNAIIAINWLKENISHV